MASATESFPPPSQTGLDVHGVPETLAAAARMTPAERLDVIRRLYMYIEDVTEADMVKAPRNSSGDIYFDSLLGLELFTNMTAHFGGKPLNLSSFTHDAFETFAGVEELVRLAYDALTSGA